MARFIDNFGVVLLDMMGTFMFGGDRFSEGEDYSAAYRRAGGRALSDERVNSAVAEVFRRMARDYEDAALTECFPAAESYFEQVLRERGLPTGEAARLDAVFAEHECGVVSEEYAEVLRRLSRTHRLGVVSNIWCRGERLREEFERSNVAALFGCVIFSSDCGINKPSPRIFREALALLGSDARSAVFVGDSLARDIAGAKAAGLAAVWINSGGEASDGRHARPDKIIRHLRELL